MDEGPCDEDRGTPRMGGWHIPYLLLARRVYVPGWFFDSCVTNNGPSEPNSYRHARVGVSNHLQGWDGPCGAAEGGDLREGLVSRGCWLGPRQRLPHGEFRAHTQLVFPFINANLEFSIVSTRSFGWGLVGLRIKFSVFGKFPVHVLEPVWRSEWKSFHIRVQFRFWHL